MKIHFSEKECESIALISDENEGVEVSKEAQAVFTLLLEEALKAEAKGDVD